MKLNATATLADAWAMFVRDRDVLIRVAAPFLFLPALALALLVPVPPELGATAGEGEAQALAWMNALSDWMGAHGGWYLLAYCVGYVGMATIYALKLDPQRPAVRGALEQALRILPRYLLAMILVGLPSGIGLLLWVIPGLYVLGRAMCVGPVLLAERPISAIGAIRRSVALSRGSGLQLAWLASITLLGGWVASQPMLMLDRWIRDGNNGNPVALGIVDAAAAAVAMLAGLATALVATAAYRRLASNGI